MKFINLTICFFFCTIVQAQLIHDESHLDQDFWEFKTQLEYCVQTKNLKALKPLLADTILESNDGCGHPGCPKATFLEYYFENKETQTETWATLATILRFGFRRMEDNYPNHIIKHDKKVYLAPSYLKEVDTDTELIVLGERVNIRTAPSRKARIIRQASFEKFKCDCNIGTMTDNTFQRKEGLDWVEVILKDGTRGYLAEKYTSYSLIKELTVAKVKGEWKIISFYNSPGC